MMSRSIAAISSYEADRSLDHKFRRSIVNWRIQAELQMFIGQTGMNLGQAAALTLRQFSYASDIDGYKVRDYKERRGGEVLFEIFSEYRSHFERYLEWRRKLFPNEARLFPILRNEGSHEDSRIRFHVLRNACALAGIDFITPSALRGTRINWLLRRSGDADLTSEMAQHTPRTLLTVYERPSLQRAISEITQFHAQHDPALADKAVLHAVGPGVCDGVPKVSLAKPDTAPEPDCQRPSGCLWCEHHRDIDSQDYVWSMTCFRHLKILELSKQPPIKKGSKTIHPAEHAIERLSAKLAWFRQSNATRRAWVEEALARVEEGSYHDQWSYLIKALEGGAL